MNTANNLENKRNEHPQDNGSEQDAPNTQSPSTAAGEHPILFFDGVCGLCNRFVDFLLRHDSQAVFRVAPLQGETASQLLNPREVEELKSIVLVDESGEHRRSAAVVRVLQRLGGFWKILAGLLWIIPKPLRDLGYNLIARYRYRIFGKKESCRMPTPAERARFLP